MSNSEGNEVLVQESSIPEICMEDANEDKAKHECDVLSFLKGLKLEEYYEKMVLFGGDKLGQLIYVDEQTIDQFCREVSMKTIHAGVFKRAIKECKLSTRLSANESHERLNPIRNEHPPHSHSYVGHYHNSYLENNYSSHERPKIIYTSDPGLYSGIHSTTPIIAPHSQSDHISYYSRPLSYCQNDSIIRQGYYHDDNLRAEHEKPLAQVECTAQTSAKSSEPHGSLVEYNADGSYNVQVGDRCVKFPASVKCLTLIDRIDSERLEIIRKGAQIYGRDDTKRKNNELTPLEVFMNEIAFEICLRDFTYMISRQKLLGLVREIVKDNQMQFSSHHSHPSSLSAVIYNGKGKCEKSKHVIPNALSSDCIVPSMISTSEKSAINDYEAILYHKTNKEWPPGVSKEQKKYLGRRSCNFELIDNSLYYSKDHKRRLWIDDPSEIEKTFLKFHVDHDTNCHYSKEATIERISQFYYIKNLAHKITEMYWRCSSCQEKHRATIEDYYKRHGINNNQKDSEANVVSVYSVEINPDLPPLTALDPEHKRKCSETTPATQPPAKRPRKSTPRKLILSHLENDLLEGDTSKKKTEMQFPDSQGVISGISQADGSSITTKSNESQISEGVEQIENPLEGISVETQ